MTPFAILILLCSACIHAGWNLLGKRVDPSLGAFLVANCAALLLLLPVGLYYRNWFQVFPFSVWILVMAAGCAQAVYYGGLAGAYRAGELSLIYPIVRSLPVLMIGLVSMQIGSGETLSAPALSGMILITLGGFLLPLESERSIRISRYLNIATGFAVVAALGTVGYTVLDDYALQILRSLPALETLAPAEISVLYLVPECAFSVLFLGLFRLVGARRVQQSDAHPGFSGSGAGKPGPRWPRIGQQAVMGVAVYITYGLVLVSLPYVRNVGYAAAFRQISIPIGVFLGIRVLREPWNFYRILGSCAMTLGVMLVAIG